MGKIKIHEIAKKLGLASKEVLDEAKKLNIEAKSHLSSVSEEEAKQIEENLNKKVSKNENKEEVKKEKKNKETEKKKEEKAPVIIRREVIVTEEETNKEKQNKTEEKKETVGFVERKKNKDFNIVYRNKPNKPMTVSELFGLKKEEPPKAKQEEKNKQQGENKKEENKQEEKSEQNEQKTSKATQIKEKEQSQGQTKEQEKQVEKTKTNDKEKEESNKIQGDSKTYMQTKTNMKQQNNAQRSNNYNNRDNNFKNRNNDNRQNNKFNNERNNRQNSRNNGNNNENFRQNNRFGNKRPLDEKGIEKNIKNIMSVDVAEKEVIREYNNKNIDKDKQKNNNKFDETRNKKSKNRKNQNNNFDEGKLKSLKQANRLSNMFDDQEGGMLDYYDLTTQRGRRGKKKVQKGDEERNKQKIFQLTEIEIPETITVKDLAQEMKKTTADVIKKLLGYGIMATINQELDFDTAFLVAGEFGITAKKKETVTEEDILFDESEDKEEDLVTRPPVVVVMGHVDHGKTSLLDTIRKTNVISGEAGGITQAIGAYTVKINDRQITFLDTPGHEAFTAMRARGAQITDIAILVVAANDGVMPQTVEAINHAKSAGIPIIVAINKIDLPDSNPEKVKQELMQYELVPEEWGGDTICVPISAKNNINIDQLLEMVLLEADVLELKANPKKQAKGVVIEARLDKSRGAIASMLVQRGTLDTGDTIVVGSSIGRIRSMVNDKGQQDHQCLLK